MHCALRAGVRMHMQVCVLCHMVIGIIVPLTYTPYLYAAHAHDMRPVCTTTTTRVVFAIFCDTTGERSRWSQE